VVDVPDGALGIGGADGGGGIGIDTIDQQKFFYKNKLFKLVRGGSIDRSVNKFLTRLKSGNSFCYEKSIDL
jgi:hypothetical protein